MRKTLRKTIFTFINNEGYRKSKNRKGYGRCGHNTIENELFWYKII